MMHRLQRIGVVVALVGILNLGALAAQEGIAGTWNGTLGIAGMELDITVVFEEVDGALSATIDIPAQGAAGVELGNVSFEDPAVHFEIPMAAQTAVFDGELAGDSISGSMAQSGYEGTFSLARSGATAETPVAEAEPLPYLEEEVTFQHEDVTLAGTLTIPEGPGPFPAVVMITGSGPQNRDEELFGFRPFRIIADHLTRNGIAVLRYDDRGVGGSTGSTAESTTEDFAGDVFEATRFLQRREEIDATKVGLVGHSEGGIVAPMVAAHYDSVAFIVLMAGTAVTGEEILYAQGEAILRANGGTEEEIQRQRETQSRTFEVVRSGEGMEELEADIREQARAEIESLTPEQRAAIADVDAVIDGQVTGQFSMIQSPWFEFFLDYDPAIALEQVTIPVLALFGGLDLQVPPDVNREPMARALERAGNDDVTIHTFPNANHLFLPSVTGSPNEYATLDKEFVQGFLEWMTEWILARSGEGN